MHTMHVGVHDVMGYHGNCLTQSVGLAKKELDMHGTFQEQVFCMKLHIALKARCHSGS